MKNWKFIIKNNITKAYHWSLNEDDIIMTVWYDSIGNLCIKNDTDDDDIAIPKEILTKLSNLMLLTATS